MFFNVTNKGRGPRHVRDADGRSRVLASGQTTKLDLLPDVALAMHRLQQRPAKNAASLVIEATDAESDEALHNIAPKAKSPHRPPGSGPLFITEMPAEAFESAPQASPYREKAPDARTELLERADELKKDDLKQEIELLLGKDTPKGLNKMTKAELKELLEE